MLGWLLNLGFAGGLEVRGRADIVVEAENTTIVVEAGR